MQSLYCGICCKQTVMQDKDCFVPCVLLIAQLLPPRQVLRCMPSYLQILNKVMCNQEEQQKFIDLHGCRCCKKNKPDGTEGYATLTLQKEHLPSITTIGYFVKDDAIMQSYLENVVPDNAQPKDLNFVYFYRSEPDLDKTLLRSFRIEVHRFKKENSPKDCIIENRNEPSICKKNPHIFLPASHDKLKKSKFLKKYSKSVTSTESLSKGNYKGVEFMQKQIPRSVEFSVSVSNSNNELCIEAGVFENLRDGGPLLYEEEEDNWALVGWYEKDSQRKRITVHHLRVQEPLYIWKDQSCLSASYQPDGLAGNGQSSSGYMSNNYQVVKQRKQPDERTTEERPNQINTKDTKSYINNVDRPEESPTNNINLVYQDTRGIPVQDVLKYQYVVDCLKDLDIDYGLKRNWRQLAEELMAPYNIREICNSYSKHSPTMAILHRPNIKTNTSIQDLIQAVKKANRHDVKLILEKITKKDQKIGEIEDKELLESVATKLDQTCYGISNWKEVGKNLGIGIDDLDLIESDGKNPAEELLVHAYSCVKPTLTKAGKFREIIEGFTKRTDLHDLMDKMGIKSVSDSRALKTVIAPNSKEMKEMSAALNRCSDGQSNWKQLANAWGLTDTVIDRFDYPPNYSPTLKLIEWMRTGMSDNVNVHQFLGILEDKLERYDVKERVDEAIKDAQKKALSDKQNSTSSDVIPSLD